MTVAVCTLGCDRKANEGFTSWPYLFQLEGDYTLYFNYEGSAFTAEDAFVKHLSKVVDGDTKPKAWSFDCWNWYRMYGDNWRPLPKFDQDQARHKATTTARNMCRMYAMEMGASHLLFIDADIIPPLDIIPKMLEIQAAGEDAVCGLVNGRGIHSHVQYVFGSKGFETIAGVQCQRVEHANIGFTMLSRKLFETTAIRYGRTIYSDGSGRDHLTSDDPAFHADCFRLFGKWPVIRMDVVGKHIGDLKASDVAQY